MNKGHIQAERAEAISKAMNTGTTDNVENVNRERSVAQFHVNAVTGIATAWKHDEHGTRAHVYQQGGAHRWHVTHNGVDGMPTVEGSEAGAAKALTSAALAMGCNGYKLS